MENTVVITLPVREVVFYVSKYLKKHPKSPSCTWKASNTPASLSLRGET